MTPGDKRKWITGAVLGVLLLAGGAWAIFSGPGGLPGARDRKQIPGVVAARICERLKKVELGVDEVRTGNNRVVPAAVDELCTHGPDPAPPGIDINTPRPLGVDPPLDSLPIPIPRPGGPPGEPTTAATIFPGIGCYGDGQSGNRVQAVYAVPADRPDRYDQVLPSIRQWAADTDAVFQASANKTGGLRRIRFVTDSACNLMVQRVRVTAAGDDTFDKTVAELQAQGLNRVDRKYLVWMDSTVLCGVASYYNDDRPTGNYNDGAPGIPGSIARTDSGCWGLASRGQSVEAHELMHSLGAVVRSAPNASAAGHCNDDSDRMCYQDGTVSLLRTLCPVTQENLFDCGNDDYFHTAPGAGSYLARHWDAANSSFLSSAANDRQPSGVTPIAPVDTTPTKGLGYWFVASDGGIFSFGDGKFFGSTGDIRLNQPVVGMARIPSGKGYWLVARDGGIFSFGDAKFYGSTGNIRLNQPIVGMAVTPTGRGYWFVAADGGIFNYGDAGFFGSAGNISGKQPIAGMAATPSGQGYWLVGADGRVFPYGDARSFGTPSRVGQPIVGIAATPSGGGYWMAGREGAVYAFGDAASYPAVGPLNQPVVGLAAVPKGQGFWLVASDGGIFSFGDAKFYGSTGNIRLNRPIVGMASTPAA